MPSGYAVKFVMNQSKPPPRPTVALGFRLGAGNCTLLLSSIVALGTIALVIFILDDGTSDSKDAAAITSAATERTPEAAIPNRPVTSALARTSPTGRARQETPAPTRESADAGSIPIPTRVWLEPSPLTKQLLQSLIEVDPRPEKMTPEASATWQQNLIELQNHGAAAVSAIAQYFEQHPDIRFEVEPDGDSVRQQAVRIALLKMLFNLPAPDNVILQEQLLQTTVNPEEVAVLASQLELQVPGEYHDIIVKAAKAALESVRNGSFPGRDPGPMVRLLRLKGEFEEQ